MENYNHQIRMLEENILKLSSKLDHLEQQHDETLTPVHSNVVTTNHTASTESDDFRFSSEMQGPQCYRCLQYGHIQRACRVQLDHSRRSRPEHTFSVCHNVSVRPRGLPDGLVGNANEATVSVNGNHCKCLLDTGSSVSTVSEAFYREFLSPLTVHPLDALLEVECADGESIPYRGYVEVTLIFHQLLAETPCSSLLLVVPDSQYNKNVPILVGTNILTPALDDCRLQYGTRFLQCANLQTPFYLAFRAIVLQEKELTHNKFRLALVRNASESIIIPPNRTMMLRAWTSNKTRRTCPVTFQVSGSDCRSRTI